MFGLSMFKGEYGALHKNLDPGTSEFRRTGTVSGRAEPYLCAVAAVRVAPGGDESTGPFEERWALFKSEGGLPGKAVPWPKGHPPLSDTSIDDVTTLFRWSWDTRKDSPDTGYDGEEGTYKLKLHEDPAVGADPNETFANQAFEQIGYALGEDPNSSTFRESIQFMTGTWRPYTLVKDGTSWKRKWTDAGGTEHEASFEAECTHDNAASMAGFQVLNPGGDVIARVYREYACADGTVVVHQIATPAGLPGDVAKDKWLRFQPIKDHNENRDAFLLDARNMQEGPDKWVYSRGTTKLYTHQGT